MDILTKKEQLFSASRALVILVAIFAQVACDKGSNTGGLPVPEAPAHQFDTKQVAMGKTVYQANCTTCHGDTGQGAANWTKRGPDGKFPPPPLNGSGHTWHHSLEVLSGIIRNGSPDNKASMPAFGERLTDQEIQAVITWIQSNWPGPVYDAWYEMQQRGR